MILPLRFETISWMFVQPERERLEEVLTRLKAERGDLRLLAPIEQFDRFFDALLRFKDVADIRNTSSALAAMLDIVEAWITEHEATEQPEEAPAA